MINFLKEEQKKHEFEPSVSLNHLKIDKDVKVRIVTIRIDDEDNQLN